LGYFDDLPDEAEYDMLSLLEDEGGEDVNYSAADRSRGLDSKIEILYLVVD
jgi:hypothetical protein